MYFKKLGDPVDSCERENGRRSDEFLKAASMDGEEAKQFISTVYRSVLRREPDAEGLAYFVGLILGGESPSSILTRFMESAEFGSAVKLWVPPGHFYSPIVNPLELGPYIAKKNALRMSDSLPGLKIDRRAMIELWNTLLPFLMTCPFREAESPLFNYRFDNFAYSWADGSILHAMLRHFQPKKLIEIGSGWSTACSIDTIKYFMNGTCEFTLIEPYADLARSTAGGLEGVHVLEQPVQDVPLSLFEQLEANDILFIDSTHVVRTGSDVCFEIQEVLPRLASGVIVHFHDVFWPFDYPNTWIMDENRSWSEVYLLRALLTDNPGWEILFFNDYMAFHEREMIAQTYPNFLRNTGGALWLRRC